MSGGNGNTAIFAALIDMRHTSHFFNDAGEHKLFSIRRVQLLGLQHSAFSIQLMTTLLADRCCSGTEC
jgi:hypothetical protein